MSRSRSGSESGDMRGYFANYADAGFGELSDFADINTHVENLLATDEGDQSLIAKVKRRALELYQAENPTDSQKIHFAATGLFFPLREGRSVEGEGEAAEDGASLEMEAVEEDDTIATKHAKAIAANYILKVMQTTPNGVVSSELHHAIHAFATREGGKLDEPTGNFMRYIEEQRKLHSELVIESAEGLADSLTANMAEAEEVDERITARIENLGRFGRLVNALRKFTGSDERLAGLSSLNDGQMGAIKGQMLDAAVERINAMLGGAESGDDRVAYLRDMFFFSDANIDQILAAADDDQISSDQLSHILTGKAIAKIGVPLLDGNTVQVEPVIAQLTPGVLFGFMRAGVTRTRGARNIDQLNPDLLFTIFLATLSSRIDGVRRGAESVGLTHLFANVDLDRMSAYVMPQDAAGRSEEDRRVAFAAVAGRIGADLEQRRAAEIQASITGYRDRMMEGVDNLAEGLRDGFAAESHAVGRRLQNLKSYTPADWTKIGLATLLTTAGFVGIGVLIALVAGVTLPAIAAFLVAAATVGGGIFLIPAIALVAYAVISSPSWLAGKFGIKRRVAKGMRATLGRFLAIALIGLAVTGVLLLLAPYVGFAATVMGFGALAVQAAFIVVSYVARALGKRIMRALTKKGRRVSLEGGGAEEWLLGEDAGVADHVSEHDLARRLWTDLNTKKTALRAQLNTLQGRCDLAKRRIDAELVLLEKAYTYLRTSKSSVKDGLVARNAAKMGFINGIREFKQEWDKHGTVEDIMEGRVTTILLGVSWQYDGTVVGEVDNATVTVGGYKIDIEDLEGKVASVGGLFKTLRKFNAGRTLSNRWKSLDALEVDAANRIYELDRIVRVEAGELAVEVAELDSLEGKVAEFNDILDRAKAVATAFGAAMDGAEVASQKRAAAVFLNDFGAQIAVEPEEGLDHVRAHATGSGDILGELGGMIRVDPGAGDEIMRAGRDAREDMVNYGLYQQPREEIGSGGPGGMGGVGN
ncbi:MAG: hypothetical protein JXR42_03675 [Gammaproteobacteria bacterium]|nr:hypothetical protein [Gammaproteobacteria bacterium]